MDVIDKYIDIYEKCQLSQYRKNKCSYSDTSIWKIGDIFNKLYSLKLYILRYEISYEISIFKISFNLFFIFLYISYDSIYYYNVTYLRKIGIIMN